MSKLDKPKIKKPKLDEPKSSDRPNQSKSLPSTAELHPIQLDETIVAGRRPKPLNDLARLLMEMSDFNSIAQLTPADISGNVRFDVKKFENKISQILNTKDIDVGVRNLLKYLEYLKANLKLPCNVTGREDFPWEEEYVAGSGSKKEYERLKKTQPSYTDTFLMSRFKDSVHPEDGIFVSLQRISDKKEFLLPLVDLKISEASSPNNQLLDDYTTWFVNY
ncbi:MAG: hypothetical protein HC789_21060 [Microcoleus sp. CSU_2_2]|nr:hypothetical protein [Microcoleus sp. SU_5_3]NJS12681.1 hypothetical protein [Microcoleus sp. CSU_2_2]